MIERVTTLKAVPTTALCRGTARRPIVPRAYTNAMKLIGEAIRAGGSVDVMFYTPSKEPHFAGDPVELMDATIEWGTP